MNKVDALVEEVLKELLLDVELVGKHFAVERLGEDPPHPWAPVVYVCGSQAEGEHIAHLVAQQMKLEPMTPTHRPLSVLGKPIKNLVEFPSHVVAYGNHRTVHETNARALSKTLDAHEEEVIVLEVAERAKMVAQQNGYDFALGHLPFAVSHALISLVDGCEMEVFS